MNISAPPYSSNYAQIAIQINEIWCIFSLFIRLSFCCRTYDHPTRVSHTVVNLAHIQTLMNITTTTFYGRNLLEAVLYDWLLSNCLRDFVHCLHYKEPLDLCSGDRFSRVEKGLRVNERLFSSLVL